METQAENRAVGAKRKVTSHGIQESGVASPKPLLSTCRARLGNASRVVVENPQLHFHSSFKCEEKRSFPDYQTTLFIQTAEEKIYFLIC